MIKIKGVKSAMAQLNSEFKRQAEQQKIRLPYAQGAEQTAGYAGTGAEHQSRSPAMALHEQ